MARRFNQAEQPINQEQGYPDRALLPDLPGILGNEFESIHEQGRQSGTRLTDFLISAFANHPHKSENLPDFAFDSECNEVTSVELRNLHRLHDVRQVPTDQAMHERLDMVRVQSLQGCFTSMFGYSWRGRALEDCTVLAITC